MMHTNMLTVLNKQKERENETQEETQEYHEPKQQEINQKSRQHQDETEEVNPIETKYTFVNKVLKNVTIVSTKNQPDIYKTGRHWLENNP